MPYLLDQIRRAGAIVAEGGLEQASFVAAARMSWVEHVFDQFALVDERAVRVLQDRHGNPGDSSNMQS